MMSRVWLIVIGTIIGTFCGVFRRQALDKGGAILAVDHIVTGHNADDVAETVLMNGNKYFPLPTVQPSDGISYSCPQC
jgi:hypothetical protein